MRNVREMNTTGIENGAGKNYKTSHRFSDANVSYKKDGTKIIRTASGLVKVQQSIFTR